MPDPQIDIDVIKEITDMFIEAGIHMDAVNVEGLTAVQNCTSRKLQISILLKPCSVFYILFFLLIFSLHLCVCVQLTFKYCCVDTNSMRSAYDVLHHDV